MSTGETGNINGPCIPDRFMLILDKAYTIKNRESHIYQSISTLRYNFDSYLIITGTPLDNKWDNSYTLLSILRGHRITSFLLFQAAFLQSSPSGPGFPEGYHRARYIQILDACSLRRPQTVIEQEFPELHRKVIAQQYAYHPMLVKLKFETAALARAMRRNEGMDTTEQGDQEATDQLIKWKRKLEQDENWLSTSDVGAGRR
ncbi:uncharacterized protein FTOL_08372 [Fusarium torulosum]|uniref:SNF2 N-terminal domain-containing protein n=1 Tax=Fusarium torulosum TaxID=33205 RepID=A0AAE8MF63_9HYPO|nr:uncharacterized protein FTOL_08372 [Fusarium torulosum]